MKVTSEMIHREIAGEHLLIPVGATALKVHGMITLTESGVLLWDCLQKDCSQEELVQAILGEYDIDKVTAEKDVEEFLQKLEKIGVLERTDCDEK